MIRRRPIPRSPYRWQPEVKGPSLRYTVNADNSVRTYPDGREVCQDNPQGRREYARRVRVMVERQRYRCCLCNDRLRAADATFEHQRRRGLHAAFRDDRIEKDGQFWNGAAHWLCNSEKG